MNKKTLDIASLLGNLALGCTLDVSGQSRCYLDKEWLGLSDLNETSDACIARLFGDLAFDSIPGLSMTAYAKIKKIVYIY